MTSKFSMFLKVTENFCKVLTRPGKGNTVKKTRCYKVHDEKGGYLQSARSHQCSRDHTFEGVTGPENFLQC